MPLRKSPTERFSDRVADYVRYRPRYPGEMIFMLMSELGMQPGWTVADIGSGTGISTEPFLGQGFRVYGVEPNPEMRAAAESLLHDRPEFVSVDGSAEAMGLPPKSVDLIFCGQAFHWFDRMAAKTEFRRVLRDPGHIVLAWNRRVAGAAFQEGYEDMLTRLLPEYRESGHRDIPDAEIAEFFHPKPMQTRDLYNSQHLDFEGLKGRLLSSSYCPKSGPVHGQVMKAAADLFDRFQDQGKVTMKYRTDIYWC